MSRRFALVLTLLASVSVASGLDAAEKDGRPNLNDVSMEVAALQTLRGLALTPAQMKTLAMIGKDTAQKPRRRTRPKVSEKYQALLLQQRDALRLNDSEKIDALADKLESLRDVEEPELDDTVQITEAARQKAPEALKLLAPKQVTEHLAGYDPVPDPLNLIQGALKDGLDQDKKEWKETRDTTAKDVAMLLAGFDEPRARKLREQTTVLLDQGHAWTKTELAEKQEELAKAVAEIVGDVGPVEMIRNLVLRDLAELLSNPMLGKAIEARVKE